MNITKEQRNVLEIIMNNKETLEELLKGVSSQKQAKELLIGEGITVAGIIWNKFAEDSDGNAYMLADKNIFDMAFGDNNNWKESPIREKLNGELYQKIVEELGAEALDTIQTDLFSHDGLRDYGKCDDMVSLLTYDLYRNNRENIRVNDKYYWTCTPNSTPSGYGTSYVQCVYSGGNVGYSDCGYRKGVRPFFILKSDIFVSCDNAAGGQ